MRVAMIYPNYPWHDEVNYQLGVAMLVTLLRQHGHNAQYFVYYSKKDLAAIHEFNPDVLGYYWLEFQTPLIREIIEMFPTKHHVAGGPYPTIRPECISELPLDAIFRGEADRGWPQYIDSGCKNTSIPGFIFKDKVNPLDARLTSDELNKLPMVLREPYTERLLKADRVKRWESKCHGAIHFSAGRGCPFVCRFCANAIYNSLWKPSAVFRSPDHLIHEIKTVCEKYQFGTVVFTDDIVTVDREWFNTFLLLYCAKIRDKYQKTLIINTRIECINEDQMRLLKDAKCVLLRAGIESGSPKVRALMGRPMGTEEIYATFCKMADAGLRTYSYNLLGYPGETLQDWEMTYDLNVRIAAYCKTYKHLGMINVFYPYRGTPIGDECYAKGYVDLEALKTAHPHYDYALKTPFITKEQIDQAKTEWPFNHGG